MMRITAGTYFAFILCQLGTGTAAAEDRPKPDFNRDIRPILSNHCYKCHGPATQKAGLRLDSADHSKKRDAVVPGKPKESELIYRVESNDLAERMPPPEAGDGLTPEQVRLLNDWIASGAEYTPHWAFVPPTKPELPEISSEPKVPGDWSKNPIDRFVWQQLHAKGIEPSAEADKVTLIRRAYLDLIGLLPSPEEVDRFVKDESEDAYERLVDRLLASEHYGERQARHWLDMARYADSNGYTIDGVRSIWPYRDWVIRAFNDDMPFDQFTIEQLAGDLLPEPTEAQLIATGFHRNTAYNEEGGTDKEQFRVERTIDRTNTTGAVWLGLTVACSQCHDHKYDPLSQKEYFQLYAFFNTTDEPVLTLGGKPELEEKINQLTEEAEELRREEKKDELAKKQAEIRKLRGQLPSTLIVREQKKPRESYVQIRGDFLRKGDTVVGDFPNWLPGLEFENGDRPERLTRLDLARWLVSGEHPLTGRVTVNRFWQQLFGVGLVETENDFGMQGTLPTHPELLDYLAVEFVANGWSVKKLHKLIVTSATYKQSSAHRAELFELDPLNKLLGRQNRLRLEAEIIRDAALSASGKLTRQVGGPGVYPPQPSEVFAFTQSRKAWNESQGPARYRRGMYTFIFRQSQHHLLSTFDAADAQVACTRRNRSNTPLQALHLANDPVFIELAEALGERIEKEGPKGTAGKIDFAFALTMGRQPTDAERQRLLDFYESQHATDPKTAWVQVGRVMLNLDEFITRE